eukprot:Hpha_TRINITY_DN16920_c2_g2::TRINITY_DN16920_c2_g2_i12::g.52525::m.52525
MSTSSGGSSSSSPRSSSCEHPLSFISIAVAFGEIIEPSPTSFIPSSSCGDCTSTLTDDRDSSPEARSPGAREMDSTSLSAGTISGDVLKVTSTVSLDTTRALQPSATAFLVVPEIRIRDASVPGSAAEPRPQPNVVPGGIPLISSSFTIMGSSILPPWASHCLAVYRTFVPGFTLSVPAIAALVPPGFTPLQTPCLHMSRTVRGSRSVQGVHSGLVFNMHPRLLEHFARRQSEGGETHTSSPHCILPTHSPDTHLSPFVACSPSSHSAPSPSCSETHLPVSKSHQLSWHVDRGKQTTPAHRSGWPSHFPAMQVSMVSTRSSLHRVSHSSSGTPQMPPAPQTGCLQSASYSPPYVASQNGSVPLGPHARIPIQCPARQESLTVSGKKSSHGVPSERMGSEQNPVAGSHSPTSAQSETLSHTTPMQRSRCPAHTPSIHESLTVAA